MSNAVAVIGLTYRGTDIQEPAFGIFLEIVRGLQEVPTVRGTDVIVPGRAGRILGTRVSDVLKIELEGIVTGAGVGIGVSAWIADGWTDPGLHGPTIGSSDDAAGERSSYRAKAKALRALFDPTISGPLVASLEDGTTKTINARTLNTIWDQPIPILARVNVQLESVDPDWV